MEYKPSLPKTNDNISHEHPLKDFIVILSWLAALSLLVFWLLGLAVDAAVDRISPETEATLTKLASVKIPATPADALPEQAQVQALLDGMMQCAGITAMPPIRLLKSKVPNAAVFPGGHIIASSGLLDRVKSANGLSFVLAHEMAHMRNRDHLRGMGRGIVLFVLSALVMGDSSHLAEVLAPVNQLGQSKYSREREALADVEALRILHCRYGHAGGATELFEAFKDEDGEQFQLSHYVASHPSMQARIDALNRAIKVGRIPIGEVTPLVREPKADRPAN